MTTSITSIDAGYWNTLSGKAAWPAIHAKDKKQTNFQLVKDGVCPHDNGKLQDEVKSKGVGVTRKCEKCGHVWYQNRLIHTTKCITCSGQKRVQQASNPTSHESTLDVTSDTKYNSNSAGMAELADAADLKF